MWGLGGLCFTSLLYQSRTVPRFFAVWGFVGYLIFMAGTILEIFGHKYGLLLNMPGGLFELSLSGWLMIKGFATGNEI